MSDVDFVIEARGDRATLLTNNWTTTQWIRENSPGTQGTVKGGVYATIEGKRDEIATLARAMVAGGRSMRDPGGVAR